MTKTPTLTIRTKYTTDAKGAGKIVAKGGGKQRTVSYDPERDRKGNHGAAAGVLGNLIGVTRDDVDQGRIVWHDEGNDGMRFVVFK